MPASGAVDRGVLDALLERGDLRVGGREPGAGRLDLLRPWRRSSSRSSPSWAARTRSCGACSRALATSRLVAASSRCFCEPEFDLSSVSKRARSVSAAARSSRGAGDVGLGALCLGLGLPDVLRRAPAWSRRSCAPPGRGRPPARRSASCVSVVSSCAITWPLGNPVALGHLAARPGGRRPATTPAPRSPRRCPTRGRDRSVPSAAAGGEDGERQADGNETGESGRFHA